MRGLHAERSRALLKNAGAFADLTWLVLPPGAVRLVLATLVLVSHLSRLEIGRFAVLVFFYLSGFWVTRLWETQYAPHGSLGQFYLSRAMRIMPLYWLVVAIVAVGKEQLSLTNITLLGIATTEGDLIGVSWSLDMELQFYLLLPILALLPSVPLLVASLVVAPFALWASLDLGVATVLVYLPVFVLGMITWQRRWRPTTAIGLGSLLVWLAITAILFLLPLTRGLLDKAGPNLIDQDLFAFLWVLPILPYVATSLTLRSGQVDRHIGNLSYPLYLVHEPIVLAIVPLGGMAMKLVAVALAAAATLSLYLLFDRPLERLRSRLAFSGRSERRAGIEN